MNNISYVLKGSRGGYLISNIWITLVYISFMLKGSRRGISDQFSAPFTFLHLVLDLMEKVRNIPQEWADYFFLTYFLLISLEYTFRFVFGIASHGQICSLNPQCLLFCQIPNISNMTSWKQENNLFEYILRYLSGDWFCFARLTNAGFKVFWRS